MTHVLQALDQTFGAVKKNMQRRIHHWHGENPGKRLDQYTLMKLVAYQAFEETYSNKEIVKKAFKKTGIYPWNKIQPDVRKLAAGSIYKRTFVHEEYFPFPPGCSGPSDTVAPAAATTDHPPAAAAATRDLVPAAAAAATADHVPAVLFAPPAPDNIVPEPEAPVIADYADPFPSTSSASSSDAMLRESSNSSTVTLPATSTSTVDLLLQQQSLLTSRQKEKQLQSFEAVIPDDDLEKFEELYSKAMFDVPHSRFQAWLQLKQQAVGTEEEALDRVLSSRMPKNIPKKKTTRTNDMPKGDARYAPQHQEFYGYFARCEERAKGKRKVTATTTSADPPALAPKPPAAKRQRKTKSS